MNRKSRRGQSSRDRKAVKGIAKGAGLTEPTASEKDPGLLALKIRALEAGVENLTQAFNENFAAVKKGLSMNDVNQQVLMRLSRDVTAALVRTRKFCVDGDTSLSPQDFYPLKIHEEGTLNMHAYYEEYRELMKQAGPELADVAAVIWSHGSSPEDALERARLEHARRSTASEREEDPDYEIEYYGKDHHQQDQAPTQEAG